MILLPVLRVIYILELERIEVEHLDNAVGHTQRGICVYSAENKHLIRVRPEAFVTVSAVVAHAVVDLDPFKGGYGEDVDCVVGSSFWILTVVATVDVDVVGALVFRFGHYGAEACERRWDVAGRVLLVPTRC